MNYLLFCIFFLIMPFQATYAQLKVHLWYNANWEITIKDRATYHRVAEYDPNYLDLNGKQEDTDIEGRPVMTGSYISGRKTGEFIFYSQNGNILSRGAYRSDYPVDVWSWFYPNGQPRKTIVFTWHSLDPGFTVTESFDSIGRKAHLEKLNLWQPLNSYSDGNRLKFKNTSHFILDSMAWPEDLLHSNIIKKFMAITKIDTVAQNRNARYVGGERALFEYLNMNGRYPKEALGVNGGPSGRVFVSVVIDTLGIVKSVFVLKGVNKAFNNEALRQVGLLKDWYPAIQNGKVAEDTVTIPIRFNAIIR